MGGGRTTTYCKNKKGESMGSLIPQISVKENYVPRNPSPEAKIFTHCKNAIKECDEFWVFGDIAELGCYKLVDYAIKHGKVIKYFDKYCELSE